MKIQTTKPLANNGRQVKTANPETKQKFARLNLHAESLEKKSDALESKAKNLRSEAGNAKSEQGRQVLNSRADALDLRAASLDQRASTISDRADIVAIRDGFDPAALRSEINSLEKGEPLDPAPFQAHYDKTKFFKGLKVSSVRDATKGEVQAIKNVAKELGATPEKLALFDKVDELFPVSIVFMDGLQDQKGVLAATNGPAFAERTQTIVMDSKFEDSNFNDGISGKEGYSAEGAKRFLHEGTHLLQSFKIIESGPVGGDYNFKPELAAGVPVNKLATEDQAEYVEQKLSAKNLKDVKDLGSATSSG